MIVVKYSFSSRNVKCLWGNAHSEHKENKTSCEGQYYRSFPDLRVDEKKNLRYLAQLSRLKCITNYMYSNSIQYILKEPGVARESGYETKVKEKLWKPGENSLPNPHKMSPDQEKLSA